MRPVAVRLSAHLQEFVREWLEQSRVKEEGVIFPGIKRGRWTYHSWLADRPSKRLLAECKAAGLRPLTFNLILHHHAENHVTGLPGTELEAAPAPGLALEPEDMASIVLKGESEEVFIRDKPKGVVRPSEYELLAVLCKEFPKVLSKQQLTRLTGGTETWRKAWRRLRDDPDFKAELIARGELYKGVPSKGYRMNKY